MQLNEIHNPHEHASVSLKVILLVFAIILVGVLGYLVWDFKTTQDTVDYSSVPTGSDGETDDPKNYVSSEFGLEFDNPDGWQTPTAQDILDGPIAYPYKVIYLKKTATDDVYKQVAISTFDQINTSDIMAARLVSLRKVFTSKSVADLSQSKNQQLSLPDTNGGTFAFSKPEYIENASGTLRGVLYFAAIGQDNTGFLTLVAVLTDNKDTVIELWAASGKASDKFTADFQGLIDDELERNNGLHSEKVDEIFGDFYAYVKTISSSTSSETLVKEYSSVYKNLINSFALI